MTTRAQLRSTIRTELNDSGGAQLWTDVVLNELITQAIRTYGRKLSKEARTTITVIASQEAYNLPADFVKAARVEQPDDTVRVLSPRSQVSSRTSGPGTYRIWAGQILLNPIPAAAGSDQNITLEYYARYAEPTADGDTLATPASDDDVLVALACADAMRWINADEAKRQRFERQRGVSVSQVADTFDRRAQTGIADQKRRLRIHGLQVI